MKLRTARPTNDLAALEQFYVQGAGLEVKWRFEDHEGFTGVILGTETWELELITEHGVDAPRAPSEEHLLVLYLPAAEVEARAQRLDAFGFPRATPNNPWWETHGVTFEDPDGYHFVLARLGRPAAQLDEAPGVVVRAATEDDLPALTPLHAEAWTSQTTPTGGPPAALSPDRETFVAVLPDGTLAGAVQLGPRTAYAANAHVGVLSWLAVAQAARRRGIGARLSRYVIARARERGFRKLALNVLASNVAAVSLYETLGFTLEARREAEFILEGRVVDGLEFALRLDGAGLQSFG
jgi:ribosomal protein S18 acetylase RimI-like enzyme